MGCLKLTYYEPKDALEVNANFFGKSLEKNDSKPFFRLRAYTYGFNGMERDDEVSGSGNQYTTHYRQYDPRLGRWTSLDPKKQKYPSMSPYSGMGNNPLKFIDSNGDTLRLNGDLSVAFQDIMSILPEKYKPLLTLNDDLTVSFNIDAQRMVPDLGVNVVYTLVNSKKNYEWNADNKQNIKREGVMKPMPVKGISESSNTQHFFNKAGIKVGNPTANPNVDRSRTMNPNYKGDAGGSRASYIMHETLEMMIQEETGTPYVTGTNDSEGFDTGAHNKAVDMQRELPLDDNRRGSSPGGLGGTKGKY